ncbi:MAG: hypothetical protein HC879_17590 [Leptolyngbyaceae cyanobacterium SL_5_9]|nr:hypothetical protein [Leptolyngbyaceae cyanobacterium SL_5_9]NJO74056.1 hypothetical protein [Leptolyngbyaceae cyanobacterium RM1_406_9]
MRHAISICLALVLLVLLSACSPSPSPDAVNPEIANPEAVRPSPTVGSTTTPSEPIADSLDRSPSGDSASELPEAVRQRLKLFLAAETGIEAEAIASSSLNQPNGITPAWKFLSQTSFALRSLHRDIALC